MKDGVPNGVQSSKQEDAAAGKKKRNRRRRKPRSAKSTGSAQGLKQSGSKKPHDAPMTKRDLYFSLNCQVVSISQGVSAVAHVTVINWDGDVVLDTFVQVPVPVTDFRKTGISPESVSSNNTKAMSFSKARQLVHQTLKGKILVGYKLQNHLTALGLTHPTQDTRDVAQFHAFQYEEIDGVTRERVSVERPLSELAAEFLRLELESEDAAPIETCTVSIDLYKAFRNEWETSLIQRARENENTSICQQSSPIKASPSTPWEARSRTSSYDSIHSFPGKESPSKLAMEGSWYGRGQSPSQYNMNSQTFAGTPMLTSENLERLNYPGHYGAPSYHHRFSRSHYTSSNAGSSSHYEGASAMSEYATESVSSSLHDEAPSQQVYLHDQQQPSASSSWFRFGSRKAQYPQSNHQPIPMTSLTEEPEQFPMCQESIERIAMTEPTQLSSLSDENASSWFGFRRPRSPGPGLDRTSTMSRSRPSTFVKVVEPEDAVRWVEDALDNGIEGHLDSADDNSKNSSSWFNFRRPKSPGPGMDQSTIPVTRRSSLGGTDTIDTSGAKSSSHGRRNSYDNMAVLSESEGDKQAASNSWFRFRRSSRQISGGTKDFSSKVDLGDDPIPTMQTEMSVESEEDWMREVVGSPETQKKEILAFSWGQENSNVMETEVSSLSEMKTGSLSNSKESKWLSRFLRPSKNSITQEENTYSSSRDPWFDQAMANQNTEENAKVLNPHFFMQTEDAVPMVGIEQQIAYTRDRLATEATIPTVASESDEDGHSSSEMHLPSLEQGLAHLSL